ncbi:MAG TPA: helix-turn-helix domain-containing protein [Pyrinomonadaceae bacterium]
MADLTSSQASARLGVAHSTVRQWCNKGLFPNARLEETLIGSVWVIPETDLDNFTPPKMGRPSKKAGKKGGKK